MSEGKRVRYRDYIIDSCPWKSRGEKEWSPKDKDISLSLCLLRVSYKSLFEKIEKKIGSGLQISVFKGKLCFSSCLTIHTNSMDR